jgi:hypothetical protein
MCASLVPEWLGRFYSYSVFKSLFFVGQCPLDLKMLGPPKRGAVRMGPRNKTKIFAYMALMFSIKFQ